MADKDFQDEITEALKGPLLPWALSAIAAIFMAFIIGVLKWSYGGLSFGSRYDLLSLLGVWLVCFWAVALALKLLVNAKR